LSKLLKALKQSGLVAPLSKKGLRRELKAAGKLKYGQELRGLKKERRIERANQKRNDGWFESYQSNLEGVREQNSENYLKVGQQLADQSAAGTAATTAQSAALNAQRSTDAGRYGALSAPKGAATAAAGTANQTSRDALMRESLAAQGTSNFNYLGSRAHAAGAAGIASKIASRARQRVLREETRQTKRDRQDFKVDLRRELRDGERQFLSDLLANKLGNSQQALAELTQEESNALGIASLAQDQSQFEESLGAEAGEEADEAKLDSTVGRQDAFAELDDAFRIHTNETPSKRTLSSGKWRIPTEKAKDQSGASYEYFSSMRNFVDGKQGDEGDLKADHGGFRGQLVAHLAKNVKVGNKRITKAEARAYLKQWLKKQGG